MNCHPVTALPLHAALMWHPKGTRPKAAIVMDKITQAIRHAPTRPLGALCNKRAMPPCSGRGWGCHAGGPVNMLRAMGV